ncbi:AGAP007959-PA-like protein [Anopheles sinensis]|uniref:AGAP007959-PA-like protein n=1 Tax=Anopheles sinensis TaxID=74873 RepID=A0A084WHB9_ANOSI|nr:AGAP007959-PA-like protein [Anopheles sinensis]
MSHVPSHYQPLEAHRGSLHEGAFRRPYDGYYNHSERPQSYWGSEARVYDLRSRNKLNARSGTPFPDQSRAYQGSQWTAYRSFQPIAGPIQPSVAHSNAAASTSKKRRLSTVPGNDPFVDITNNRVESHGGQPKRKKVSNGHPSSSRGMNSSLLKPVPQKPSISNQSGRVRIESIFRNVELLAQSHWDTGNAIKLQPGMRTGVTFGGTQKRTMVVREQYSQKLCGYFDSGEVDHFAQISGQFNVNRRGKQMRTKPCARYVARVVDLSQAHHPESQYDPHLVPNPQQMAPINSQYSAPMAGSQLLPLPYAEPTADVSVSLRQHRKRKSPVKEPRASRTKQRTKGGKVSKDVGPMAAGATTNMPAALVEPNTTPGGLYKIDFSRLIEHNLQSSLLQQRSALAAHGNPIGRGGGPVLDPRIVHAEHTLTMWRQLMMASVALQRNQQAIMRPPQSSPIEVGVPSPPVATNRERFSIFHSVELMAQSSCPSAMGRKL